MLNSKKTFKTLLIDQSIASFVLVLVPAVVTFFMPRTTIEMQRNGGQASAKITKYILLVVPCRQLTVEPVEQAERHTTAGKYG